MKRVIPIFNLSGLIMTKDREKLLVITPRIAKKVQNIKAKPEVYFSIDMRIFHIRASRAKAP
jgi:hypothetical protein